MAVDYLAELTSQGNAFSLAHSIGEKALVYTFTLSPPTSLLVPGTDREPSKFGLSVNDIVIEPVTTMLREMDVDLPLIGKWVRVLTPDMVLPLKEDPIGGMPVADQLQLLGGAATGPGLTTTLTTHLPPESLMKSDPKPPKGVADKPPAGMGDEPGVPAVLGRVTGKVKETVKELKEVLKALGPFDVTVNVTIRVVDEDNPSSDSITKQVQMSVDGGSTWTALPSGATQLPAQPYKFSLRLPAQFSELRATTPEVVRLGVYVSVDLSVTPPGIAPVTATVNLPAVPLVLPTIPIPTIVVICEHELFFGRKLVVVPSDSLIGQAVSSGGRPVGSALTLTNDTIEALKSALAAGSGALALDGFLDGAAAGAAGMSLATVAQTIPNQTAAAVLMSLADSPGQTIIVASSQLGTLDAPNLTFDSGWWGKVTANHMASSLIVVGRPGTTVSFGQQGPWPWREQLTSLTITLGASELACVVPSLVAPNATINIPASDPRSKMWISFGGTVTSFSPKQSDNQISSIGITRSSAGLGLMPAT